MKYYQQILDDLCKQKDALCEGMTEEEIKEIDTYLEEVVKEMTPFLENINNIIEDPQKRKNVAKIFKNEIKEQGWQEKLSKII
jgi:hypothetical protein